MTFSHLTITIILESQVFKYSFLYNLLTLVAPEALHVLESAENSTHVALNEHYWYIEWQTAAQTKDAASSTGWDTFTERIATIKVVTNSCVLSREETFALKIDWLNDWLTVDYYYHMDSLQWDSYDAPRERFQRFWDARAAE